MPRWRHCAATPAAACRWCSAAQVAPAAATASSRDRPARRARWPRKRADSAKSPPTASPTWRSRKRPASKRATSTSRVVATTPSRPSAPRAGCQPPPPPAGIFHVQMQPGPPARLRQRLREARYLVTGQPAEHRVAEARHRPAGPGRPSPARPARPAQPGRFQPRRGRWLAISVRRRSGARPARGRRPRLPAHIHMPRMFRPGRPRCRRGRPEIARPRARAGIVLVSGHGAAAGPRSAASRAPQRHDGGYLGTAAIA